MLGYTTAGAVADGQPYCKHSCDKQLAICSSFNSMIGMDPLVTFGLSCDLASDSGPCHTGGKSQVQETQAVCPLPLVRPNSASFERDAHVEVIDGTACALPCPNTLR